MKMPLSHFLVSSLVIALSIPSAKAEETYIEPTESTWGEIVSDDGFSKSFTIFNYSSNAGLDDFGDEITYSMEIQCEKKETSVLVYSDPIGMYPTSDLNRVGYAQVKIDSGKIVRYKYVALKDSSGINIWSPKLLTTAVLKGKRQVAFKIPSSIQADSVANFPIKNLASYVTKFKKLGCTLK
jgi:hypothetical protein